MEGGEALVMYTNLKLKTKSDSRWYAILGQTGNGGYRVVALDDALQHGLMPRPWIHYLAQAVSIVNEGDVEEFLAYGGVDGIQGIPNDIITDGT